MLRAGVDLNQLTLCRKNPGELGIVITSYSIHYTKLYDFLLAISALHFASANEAQRPLRIGMTPAFLHNQHSMLAEWKIYLERKLQRSVIFIQRDSYRETMDLIDKGSLDFAWLCDYPYLALGKAVRLLAVASYQSRPFYRSYLIVPAKDTTTASVITSYSIHYTKLYDVARV